MKRYKNGTFYTLFTTRFNAFFLRQCTDRGFLRLDACIPWSIFARQWDSQHLSPDKSIFLVICSEYSWTTLPIHTRRKKATIKLPWLVRVYQQPKKVENIGVTFLCKWSFVSHRILWGFKDLLICGLSYNPRIINQKLFWCCLLGGWKANVDYFNFGLIICGLWL